MTREVLGSGDHTRALHPDNVGGGEARDLLQVGRQRPAIQPDVGASHDIEDRTEKDRDAETPGNRCHCLAPVLEVLRRDIGQLRACRQRRHEVLEPLDAGRLRVDRDGHLGACDPVDLGGVRPKRRRRLNGLPRRAHRAGVVLIASLPQQYGASAPLEEAHQP